MWLYPSIVPKLTQAVKDIVGQWIGRRVGGEVLRDLARLITVALEMA